MSVFSLIPQILFLFSGIYPVKYCDSCFNQIIGDLIVVPNEENYEEIRKSQFVKQVNLNSKFDKVERCTLCDKLYYEVCEMAIDSEVPFVCSNCCNQPKSSYKMDFIPTTEFSLRMENFIMEKVKQQDVNSQAKGERNQFKAKNGRIQ